MMWSVTGGSQGVWLSAWRREKGGGGGGGVGGDDGGKCGQQGRIYRFSLFKS